MAKNEPVKEEATPTNGVTVSGSSLCSVNSGNSTRPAIYSLIGKAMGMIGAIGKDSDAKNLSGKLLYKFRGIDAVYNALNPVLSELGLFIIPNVLDISREERNTTSGGVLIYTILTVRFTIYAPDGSSISGVTKGEAMDSGDKSCNKAMSAALKYFMFQTFCIPTEEMRDPDADVYDVAPKTGRAPANNTNAPANNTAAPANNPIGAPSNRTVEKTNSLPPVQSAKELIMNEIAFLAQKNGIEKPVMIAQYEAWRKSLVSGGVIPDVKTGDMTIEQAKDLIEAIRRNFPQEDGK